MTIEKYLPNIRNFIQVFLFQKLLKVNCYLFIKNLQSFINISLFVDTNCSL